MMPGAVSREPAITVICCHGIVERKTDERLERNFERLPTFRARMKWLRRQHVLTLDELSAALAARKVEPGYVVTFDDGYANNLAAAEILADCRIPWSVFITTGAVGPARPIWTVELSLLLLHGQAASVTVFGCRYLLADRSQREASFQFVRQGLKALPAGARAQALDAIREQFPVRESERIGEAFPSMRMMGWGDVERLSAAGVEIGSHGVAHEIHHEAQPADVKLKELRESKAELERRLRRPCRYFAFPNGSDSGGSAEQLETAGYELGLTTRPGTVAGGANRFSLPRQPAHVLDQLRWRNRIRSLTHRL